MHPDVALNLICFGEPMAGVAASDRSLAQNLEFCANAGFKRVSVTWNNVISEGPQIAAQLLQDSGLKVTALLSPTIVTPYDRDLWSTETAALREKLDFAAEVGADNVFGPIGPAGGLDWDEAARRVHEALAAVAAYASKAGVDLIFEPTLPMYADLNFVHTYRDAVELAHLTGLGLCLDMFPTWQERGLLQVAEASLSALRMVQLGDWPGPIRSLPNRAVLGDGVMPIGRILGGLHAMGYRGPIDIELTGPLIAKEGVEEAAVRSGRYLTDLLNSFAKN